MMNTTAPTPTKQPDRQTKLACPKCGAVARMTNVAMRLSGGILCTRDGIELVPAPPRPYVRRAI